MTEPIDKLRNDVLTLPKDIGAGRILAGYVLVGVAADAFGGEPTIIRSSSLPTDPDEAETVIELLRQGLEQPIDE